MKSIETRLFIKFLKSIGLEYKRTKGSHEIWDNINEPLLERPVIFRGNEKQIPTMHLHTNLLTLGISHKEFEDAIKKL
jgi:predicted RNA binding protein YcfA (HicA-like mRNA interferase family)